MHFCKRKLELNLVRFSLFLDIDECLNNTHICDVNAVCNNTEGSYKCACKPGYSGDGKKCNGNYRKNAFIVTVLLNCLVI